MFPVVGACKQYMASQIVRVSRMLEAAGIRSNIAEHFMQVLYEPTASNNFME